MALAHRARQDQGFPMEGLTFPRPSSATGSGRENALGNLRSIAFIAE